MPFTPTLAAGGRAGLLLLLAGGGPVAVRGDDLAVIFAQTSPSYARKKAPGGGVVPETYTLGDGGPVPGAELDPSVDRLNFMDLAKLVTGPLEAQHYRAVPDRDPNKTQLLVMVYWGTTRGAGGATGSAATQEAQAGANALGAHPPPPLPVAGAQGAQHPSNPADQGVGLAAARQGEFTGALATVELENRQRADADERNALLLGYDAALASAGGFGAAESRRADLIDELEEPRYFIVLMAYDFAGLWKHRRHTLLWVTRLSVRAQGRRFDGVAGALIAQASRYFGENSGGLKRVALPEGRVDIGAVKSLGEVPTH